MCHVFVATSDVFTIRSNTLYMVGYMTTAAFLVYDVDPYSFVQFGIRDTSK